MTSSEQDLAAGMLAARTPPLTDRTTCGEVFDWFVAHPAVPAAAIVHSHTGAVLGLINRFIFFAGYAKPVCPRTVQPQIHSQAGQLCAIGGGCGGAADRPGRHPAGGKS